MVSPLERMAGSLNLRVRGLGVSATLGINQRCNELRRAGKKIHKLGLGQSPFPVPEPVVEALRANAHQKDYLMVQGLPELRREVAGYYCRTQGLSCTEDDVLIGPGSKELMFLLQVVYYGDLLIPTPSWVSYEPQAVIVGRKVHWVPTLAEHQWRLTPDELEKLCRDDPDCPRLVILNYPSNPTGYSYREKELVELATVARRYGLIVLADEIYGELDHSGQHQSIARFYPEGTIVSSGLSKWCGAGGWRLGLFVFPPVLRKLLERMTVVASETFTATSAPIQYAAVRAFQGGPEIESYLTRSRNVLASLTGFLYQRLSATGLQVTPPMGAFYLFADFAGFREMLAARGIASSALLCERLLEESGVAVLPGSCFGRPPHELTARLATVDFDGANALFQAEKYGARALDEAFLRAHCGSVVEGVEKIAAWLAHP